MSSKSEKRVINPALRAALSACKQHLMGVAVFSFFLNLLFLAPTIYMLQVYDRVVPTGGVVTLLYLTLILVFALVVLSRLDQLRTRLLTRSSARLDKLLSGQILHRLYSIPTTGGKSAAFAGMMREFDTMKGVLSGPGVIALFDAPWIVFYLGLCFLLHPFLGALALAGGVALALITYLNERATYEKITSANQAITSAYLEQEALTSRADVIRALGMQSEMVQIQLKSRSTGVSESMRANAAGDNFAALTKFLKMLLQSVALGVGAYLAISQQISAGAIFAASLLMTRSIAPMEQIIGQWRSLTKGYNAYNKLNNLFYQVDPEPSLVQLPVPKSSLIVDNLTVANREQRRYYLQGVSFAINAGETVAVIGPSGAGKTTLAKAIVGIDAYDYGTVRFDGSERSEWDQQRLAKYIGFLPQDTCLFPGSIAANISRFEGTLNTDSLLIDQKIVEAAKAAGAHDMISKFPQGYNTVLGPGGSGLSAGQAQRIGLARALYGDPFLLVLDEPNAHLDQEGEEALIKVIHAFCERGGAVMVIVHRAAILSVVNKILFLKNGRAGFFGTRDEWVKAQQPQSQIEGDDPKARPALVKNS